MSDRPPPACGAAPPPAASLALFAALRARDLRGVRAALARGADPNLADASGCPPLAAAVECDSAEAVRLLLSAGADLSAGRALHLAIERGRPAIAGLLLAPGADARLEGAAREPARAPHRSRQQLTALARIIAPPPAPRAEPGVCCRCGGAEEIVRLIPCGHAVACRNCIPAIAAEEAPCPACGLAFYAIAAQPPRKPAASFAVAD
jgi:hypothetical protein